MKTGPQSHQSRVSTLLLVLGVLILCIHTCSSYVHGNQKLCGRKLADTLSKACHGNYNKRSGPMMELESITNLDEDSQELSDEDTPYQIYRYHYVRLPGPDDHYRRERRGITDECCRRACPWSTLLSYCSN